MRDASFDYEDEEDVRLTKVKQGSIAFAWRAASEIENGLVSIAVEAT
jgi:hypothetical protein